MKIGILGSGGVGGYFGAKLAKARGSIINLYKPIIGETIAGTPHTPIRGN